MGTELRIAVHNRLQVFFTEPISIDMMQSFVKELRLVAKQVLVATNDGFLAQLDMEVSLLLVTETNAILARFLFLL